MQDKCEKCRQSRQWMAKVDKSGSKIFRRVSKCGLPGFCRHTAPQVLYVNFPPSQDGAF